MIFMVYKMFDEGVTEYYNYAEEAHRLAVDCNELVILKMVKNGLFTFR